MKSLAFLAFALAGIIAGCGVAPAPLSDPPTPTPTAAKAITVRGAEIPVPGDFDVEHYHSDCFDPGSRGVTCYQSATYTWFLQRGDLRVAVEPDGSVTRIWPLPMMVITPENAEEVGPLASLVRAIADLPFLEGQR